VFEDDLEHNDVGWLPRNKLKSSTTNDISKTQWTLAHKQSLQSMRSILATFYNDEVEYTKTVNKLIEVYYPILQYTQAYSHLHELADFQSHFLDQLTSSLSNISSLCACFQNNIENFRVYFPYMMNYDASLNALSQCSSEELSVLTQNQAKTNEELLIEYTSPYYRLEIYCQLFQVSMAVIVCVCLCVCVCGH
jgi:DNA repair ATPase RecN